MSNPRTRTRTRCPFYPLLSPLSSLLSLLSFLPTLSSTTGFFVNATRPGKFSTEGEDGRGGVACVTLLDCLSRANHAFAAAYVDYLKSALVSRLLSLSLCRSRFECVVWLALVLCLGPYCTDTGSLCVVLRCVVLRCVVCV